MGATGLALFSNLQRHNPSNLHVPDVLKKLETEKPYLKVFELSFYSAVQLQPLQKEIVKLKQP